MCEIRILNISIRSVNTFVVVYIICLSVFVHALTHFDPVPSGSPVGLSVWHKLPTIAELSWSPFPGPVKNQNSIIRYSVEVLGPGSSRDTFILYADTTDIKIPGLRPFTSYTFIVSAITKAGTGPAATISSTTPEGGNTPVLDNYDTDNMRCMRIM